jgi:phenylalanyl-tRNA synthetase alpha chain
LTAHYTVTQQQRLKELDAAPDLLQAGFSSFAERDSAFEELQKGLAAKNRERLDLLRTTKFRTSLRELEFRLSATLTEAGFVEVATPIMLAKGMLAKMNITPEHPLYEKVYWVSKDQCLRPMLAPNLYYLLGHLGRLWEKPVRIFEIGPCFRRESKGSRHLSEFTMLNAVEMGGDKEPGERLAEIIRLVMDTTGLSYKLKNEASEVYSETVDVEVNGMEVASGAVGPHFLDHNWNIADTWAGVGFGLERLVMAGEGFNQIRRAGRSLVYLDGARLNT